MFHRPHVLDADGFVFAPWPSATGCHTHVYTHIYIDPKYLQLTECSVEYQLCMFCIGVMYFTSQISSIFLLQEA